MFNGSQWLGAALNASTPANLAQGRAGRYEDEAKQGTVMVFLRILGKALLFLAFAAVAFDGARNLATPGQGLLLASVSTHLKTYFPSTGANLESVFIANGSAWAWNIIVAPLLAMPLSLLLAVLGTAIFLAGYRKPPPVLYGD
jgi:hypothetical protein